MRVTSSDFHSPDYHIGASKAYMMDMAEYDANGDRITPPMWEAELTNTTFNVYGFPILYWPYLKSDVSQSHIPLRRIQVGRQGHFGWGVESEWHLFQLLGLLEPEGVKDTLELDAYERGVMAGIDLEYARVLPNRQYSGYFMLYGMWDKRQKDNLGRLLQDVPAPQQRGRILARHKEILPDDWTLQFELSYLCDKNFLQEFFPGEYFAGKEQETLIYARKQHDNWAFTSLLKYRLNRFQTQAESFPDLGFYLLGEPLAGGNVLLFGENHAGLERYRTADDSGLSDSDIFPRGDTRQELDFPAHLGPVNLQPYVVGRQTYWGNAPDDGAHYRPYGQAGLKSSMDFWRIYDAYNRLLDVNRLKHIITPQATVFASSADGVAPNDLYPLDPGIEQHLAKLCGATFGVLQRWQTKRGVGSAKHQTDWMRLNVVAGFYDGDEDITRQPSDGRFFWYRPEYSLPRDHVNVDYSWNISDATTLLADANYDIETRDIARADVGLAIVRDPRVRYFFGGRYIRDMDSAVGTFGVDYRINSKYSVSFFEQYDFDFHSGQNLDTSVQIIRKLPRWFVGVGFGYDATENDAYVFISVWPEGVGEVRMGGERFSMLGKSDKN